MTTSSTAEITGANLISGAPSALGPADVVQVRPRTGEPAGPAFHSATAEEVRAAVAAAEAAAPVLARTSGKVRAALLRDVADRLDAATDRLVAVADEETALGETRLRGEVARTSGQLRMFADLVERGEHLDAVIDTADPSATPSRPDLRRMCIPLGPVAVFGASNFPFAFSTAGGDTASALAAGCPVVVKAHPAHPATSELTARIVLDALAAAGLPAGCFSLLHGAGPEVGLELVRAPGITAVGFTGSTRAGRALADAAAARPVPIPVYAEMGSTNPVVITPAALAARGEAIAAGLAASFTLGNGQFCTKPGVVLLPADEAARTFVELLAGHVRQMQPGVALTPQIRTGLLEQLTTTRRLPGVEVVAEVPATGTGLGVPVVVLRADATAYLEHEELREEHFGPVVVLVECADDAERDAVLRAVPGSLTATLHAEPEEAELLAPLVEQLSRLAGRLVWNGFPTGVAVTAAQHHGGPYPATTAPWTTSVGTAAIRRFLRPVVYQDAPQSVLPRALRDDNPDGVPRLVDGVLQRGPLGER